MGKVKKAIQALAKGEKPKLTGTVNNKKIDVPSVLPEIYPVDETNIVEVLVGDEFHTLEDIYKNVPKDQWPKQ